MLYRDILVYIDDGNSNTERMKTAFDLAKAHNAQITGVTLSALKPKRVKIMDETIGEKAATSRIESFSAAAEAEGLVVKSKIILGNAKVASRKMAQFARNFDLIILRQANPQVESAALIEVVSEQVLLLSGRPIFFMPYIGAHRIPCQRAMIAWDGSPSVSRAVHDSLPLLAGLDEVVILVIEGTKKTAKGELMVDDLSRHLASHGVNTKVRRHIKDSLDVPTIILNEISDNDIDVLVMGGYGTPNLQQKIFGGVTRTLLSMMIVPVIMSH
jgi:nucleotide-binding universal stress UspA family protein